MKYYLIDFDNVNTSKDLKGWETFTSEYHIYIFYTAQKAKIDVSLADKHGKAGFEYVEVPEGKQSLDMHLVSLLGSLIGKDKDAEFVIVSKDADYDKIIKFWENRESVKIIRCSKITPLKQEEKTVVKKSNEEKNATANVKKDRPSAEIRKILKTAQKDADTINYVGNLLDAHINEKGYKQLIYRAVVSKYGQGQGLDIYNRIKKHL